MPASVSTTTAMVAAGVGAVIVAAATTRRGRLFYRVVKEMTRIVVRRLVLMRPPLRPSWSLRFELRVGVIRELLNRTNTSMSKEDRIRLAWKVLPRMRKRLDRCYETLPVDLKTRHVQLDGFDGQWVTPYGCESSGRVVFYLHGGGYSLMSTESHKGLMARVGASCDAAVFGINYRLAPENPFPAGLNDAIAAYKYLLDSVGVPPKNIVVMGDSAGGGLSVALTLSLLEQKIAVPGAVVVLSPWVDLEMSHDTWHSNAATDYIRHDKDLVGPSLYAGDESLTHPLISPVHATFTDFPPLLIQCGGCETLLGECRTLYERARSYNVDAQLEIYPDMPHVFQAFANAHYTERALVKIGHFAVLHTTATNEHGKQHRYEDTNGHNMK